MRTIGPGADLLVHTREPSVPPDLQDWARLAGHAVVASTADAPAGPWRVVVRRGAGPVARDVFSTGTAAPVGDRLWLYTNFHCNLACGYCCSASSPQAQARLLPVDVALAAADEMVALGGASWWSPEGSRSCTPDLGDMLSGLAERLPVTLLTNAMLFGRGQAPGDPRGACRATA